MNTTPRADDAVVVPAGSASSAGSALLEELLVGAVTDDQQARAALLAEVHPLALRYCRARLGRQETPLGSAEDVAQDVCLAVMRALPTYQLNGLSFRAFVYGIAAHKVTDALRATGRNHADPMAEVPDTILDSQGQPEYQILAAELSERLGELLHTLTPRQREVLVLRVAVGLSAEQTAQIVCSTPTAVRVTQHRALTRLRQTMLEQHQHTSPQNSPDSRDMSTARIG